MRISAADLYPAGEASAVMGSTSEPSASAASGDMLDDEGTKRNPVIAIFALFGLLFTVRIVWEMAGAK